MARKPAKKSNSGKKRVNDPDVVDEEVSEVFEETANTNWGSSELERKLRVDKAESPKLSGGDVDAAWDQADKGEETVGGTNPTPDQDVVDELGEAVGISYSDTEPLHTEEKLEKRDKDRWDLDPASDPEYRERVREEFEEPPPPSEKKEK